MKSSIPSNTKLEFVSPGWTLDVIIIPSLFYKSFPKFLKEVILIIGIGIPEIDKHISFLE